MASICIIPARGGSKRIAHKNIRVFAGKPIMAHSIESARQSGLFERILVSTDGEDIAAVARECGAEVPFMRPAELSDDFAGSDEVFRHALGWLDARGELSEFACFLYATAPFVRPGDLRAGLDLLRSSGAANVFSVAAYASPIQRSLAMDERGRMSMRWPEHKDTRTQDLPRSYHDAGQFYWTRARGFLETPDFYYDAAGVVLPGHRANDIDTEEDWTRAELIYAALDPLERD